MRLFFKLVLPSFSNTASSCRRSSSLLRCCSSGCSCPGFFYIFAEGAYILKCRCKHKHTDHDPKSHKCCRPNCGCIGFYSPFVCNCDHGWASHRQQAAKHVSTSNAANGIAPEINRWDLLRRGGSTNTRSTDDDGSDNDV